ncbi:MAG: PIN domain-containing protein [Cyclobacterium sp.]|nr:PIN domain-containing protein [Cyclobacterium sp.]
MLDACVLYPMTIRDLLLTFADEELFKPFWSEEIQKEWKRNLLLNRPDLDPRRIEQTSLAMDEFFPDASVEDWQTFSNQISLPDKDDHHVLAAAIKCEADYLVTSNLKDFPTEVLEKFNIKPILPDEFCSMLIQLNQRPAIKAFLKMVGRLKNPSRSISDVLLTLTKTELPKTSSLLTSLTKNLPDPETSM